MPHLTHATLHPCHISPHLPPCPLHCSRRLPSPPTSLLLHPPPPDTTLLPPHTLHRSSRHSAAVYDFEISIEKSENSAMNVATFASD
eukprot:145338-Chlamydomonas_euryale.AAC.1